MTECPTKPSPFWNSDTDLADCTAIATLTLARGNSSGMNSHLAPRIFCSLLNQPPNNWAVWTEIATRSRLGLCKTVYWWLIDRWTSTQQLMEQIHRNRTLSMQLCSCSQRHTFKMPIRKNKRMNKAETSKLVPLALLCKSQSQSAALKIRFNSEFSIRLHNCNNFRLTRIKFENTSLCFSHLERPRLQDCSSLSTNLRLARPRTANPSRFRDDDRRTWSLMQTRMATSAAWLKGTLSPTTP